MIAYFDLPSGFSGDIGLGCLVGAGWPIERLRAVIDSMSLPTAEWSLNATSVMKGPIAATQVIVDAREGHHHRHLHHIEAMIEQSGLPDAVKQRSAAVFRRLAAAEAKVHGTTIEKIHFHEVGAVDAIIDIVGVVAGLHELGIDHIHASPIPLGRGWAQTAHGRIPLPAPATLELIAAAGAPTVPAPGPGEWITPTGAALLCELAVFTQPVMHIERVGLGAGQRDADWPNIARLWLGRAQQEGPLVQIETNIDDMNPQFYESIMQQLLQAGARDVWLTPVQMKKNRPAVVLSILADASKQTVLTDLLLRHTTTLGVRYRHVQRAEAQRELRPVQIDGGTVRMKLRWVDGELVGAMPEYEDCRRIAEASGQPVREIHEQALVAAHMLTDSPNTQRPALR